MAAPPPKFDSSADRPGTALPGDRPEIHFNLTTTGDLALAGLARDTEELGIDCERVRAGRDFEGIARKMFDPEQRRRSYLLRPRRTGSSTSTAPGPRWRPTPRPTGAVYSERGRRVPRPRIVHCIPEDGYIAAVAGLRVSPVRSWTTLDFDPGSG